MFHPEFKSNYSVRTKSKVTVLEISITDFKQILNRDYLEYLQDIALSKHVMLLDRIKSIVVAS